MLSASGQRWRFLSGGWARRRSRRANAAEAGLVAAGLKELNATSERSFLRAGGQLTEFLTVLHESHDGTVAIVKLLSSEKAEAAAELLRDVLARSEEMERRVRSYSALLESVTGATRELSVPVLSFASAVRNFRVLGTLIRIESSRLSQSGAGLDALAAEVTGLTGELERRANGMLAACEALSHRVEASLARTQHAGVRQEQRLPALVQTVIAGVAAVEEKRAMAERTAAAVVERFERALALLGEVVAGLQFHDITRQRVEHVITALSGDLDGQPEDRAAALFGLQATQLRTAGDLFEQSVEGICRNLRRLASEVKDMSSQTCGLFQDSGSGGRPFFSGMEAMYTEVLGSLTDCERLDRGLPDAGEALGGAAGEIAGLAREIEAVGLRMHRIALNTSIRAVHVGVKGEPLEQLGSAIQALCSVALDGAAQVSTILESVESAHAADLNVVRRSDEALPEALALQERITRLRAAGEAEEVQAARVVESSRLLAEAVEALVEDLQRHSIFPGVAKDCAGKLERLAAGPGGAKGAHHEAHLDQLRALYTMESERAVHDRASREETAPASVLQADGVAGVDGDLGDNVELF
jgi:hypothetical protein